MKSKHYKPEPSEIIGDCPICHKNVIDVVFNDDGENFCTECYAEIYTQCSECELELYRDDAMTDENGEHFCKDCYALYISCVNCGCEVSRRDGKKDADGRYFCDDCYAEWCSNQKEKNKRRKNEKI